MNSTTPLRQALYPAPVERADSSIKRERRFCTTLLEKPREELGIYGPIVTQYFGWLLVGVVMG